MKQEDRKTYLGFFLALSVRGDRRGSSSCKVLVFWKLKEGPCSARIGSKNPK